MKNRFAVKIIISMVIFSLVFCLGLLIMGDTVEASTPGTVLQHQPMAMGCINVADLDINADKPSV